MAESCGSCGPSCASTDNLLDSDLMHPEYGMLSGWARQIREGLADLGLPEPSEIRLKKYTDVHEMATAWDEPIIRLDLKLNVGTVQGEVDYRRVVDAESVDIGSLGNMVYEIGQEMPGGLTPGLEGVTRGHPELSFKGAFDYKMFPLVYTAILCSERGVRDFSYRPAVYLPGVPETRQMSETPSYDSGVVSG